MQHQTRIHRHDPPDVEANAADLLKNPIVQWQNRWYRAILIVGRLGLPAQVGAVLSCNQMGHLQAWALSAQTPAQRFSPHPGSRNSRSPVYATATAVFSLSTSKVMVRICLTHQALSPIMLSMSSPKSDSPNTLQEAIVYFADPDNCLNYLVARRWPNGVACPTCGRTDVTFIAARRVWQCKTRHPKAQFSVKVGTIFEDSALGLDKWLMAMWMLTNCKNGISSWEIKRAIGITQKCAWHMMHRIRLAMQDDDGGMLSGEVEVDETFIGGKARNMHKHKRAEKIHGRGPGDKAIVFGMVERGGKVRAMSVDTRKKRELQPNIREHVEAGAAIFSDELKSYEGLDEYEHEVINHAVEYVRGNVHTNTMENFWSLLKRGLHGTYVSVEPFHLFR